MSDYLLIYPKRVGLRRGLMHLIKKDDLEKETLYIVVKKSVEEITKILRSEGFHRLHFCENKQPMQLGSGFTKMLNWSWEMHVRLLDMKDGLIAIHAEVEISRRYVQHLFSQRGPIFYEMVNILKKNGIDYKILNSKLNEYVSHIKEDHKIKLEGFRLPIPWIPVCVIGGFFGLWGLFRLFGYFCYLC